MNRPRVSSVSPTLRGMKRVALLVILTAALTGCSLLPRAAAKSSPSPTPSPSRLEQVATACLSNALRVQDHGASISMDTEGEKDTSGDSIENTACILSKTGAPSYVVTHIDSTRALDGTQTDEWDGYKARWTYHPDNGLRITIIDTRITS
jgi:hypothetical protein